MILSPFFNYFGSKARSAKLYPTPKYDTIEEACAGGAGFALNFPELRVVLSDSDPRVCRIWSYLIGASPETILSLPLLEPGQSIDTLQVSEDARLYLSCCVNTSPFRRTLTAWKNGQNDRLWSSKRREKVASQVEAIKHWEIHHRSYEECPDIEATHFVDPPYQGLEEHYRESRERPIDYAHLAQWCRSRRGQVIVCERTGANWLPFRHLASIAAVRNADGRSCQEAIWTNDGEPLSPPPRQPRGQVALF